MSVKIKIPDAGTAVVENGKWKYASNGYIRDLLVGIDEERLDEEVGYHPFPDLGIAEMAVSLLGGDIVEITDAPKMEEGVIY